MSWKDLALFNTLTSKDTKERMLNAYLYAEEMEKEEQELREQESDGLLADDDFDDWDNEDDWDSDDDW